MCKMIPHSKADSSELEFEEWEILIGPKSAFHMEEMDSTTQ